MYKKNESMSQNFTGATIADKNIDELSIEEMIFVHLSTRNTPISVKNAHLRSTLSFMNENITIGLSLQYSKQLMPYLSMCAILDQLGICYNRKDKGEPRFGNGIKRCLYYFGDLAENDELINILYALRNGLLHNISLTSFDLPKNKYYIFQFDDTIPNTYQKSTLEWDGDYGKLDSQPEKYTTFINRNKFKELVQGCIRKADELNQNSLLELRLTGGKKQLFYDYIRHVGRGE